MSTAVVTKRTYEVVLVSGDRDEILVAVNHSGLKVPPTSVQFVPAEPNDDLSEATADAVRFASEYPILEAVAVPADRATYNETRRGDFWVAWWWE